MTKPLTKVKAELCFLELPPDLTSPADGATGLDADAITLAELQERRRVIRERLARRSRRGGTHYTPTGPEKDHVGR